VVSKLVDRHLHHKQEAKDAARGEAEEDEAAVERQCVWVDLSGGHRSAQVDERLDSRNRSEYRTWQR